MQKGLILALIVAGIVLFGAISYYKAESGKFCGEIGGRNSEKQCAPGFRCVSGLPLNPNANGTCKPIVPGFLYRFLPQPTPGNVILFDSK